MRIGILSHIRFPIAAPFKGGMEAFVWHLARGMAARGHDVEYRNHATGDRLILHAEPGIGAHQTSIPGGMHAHA